MLREASSAVAWAAESWFDIALATADSLSTTRQARTIRRTEHGVLRALSQWGQAATDLQSAYDTSSDPLVARTLQHRATAAVADAWVSVLDAAARSGHRQIVRAASLGEVVWPSPLAEIAPGARHTPGAPPQHYHAAAAVRAALRCGDTDDAACAAAEKELRRGKLPASQIDAILKQLGAALEELSRQTDAVLAADETEPHRVYFLAPASTHSSGRSRCVAAEPWWASAVQLPRQWLYAFGPLGVVLLENWGSDATREALRGAAHTFPAPLALLLPASASLALDASVTPRHGCAGVRAGTTCAAVSAATAVAVQLWAERFDLSAADAFAAGELLAAG